MRWAWASFRSGPPYFNAVFVPVMVPLLLLMAVGPMAHWKHADLMAIARRLRVSMVLAVARRHRPCRC
jgi:cytochrome c-type biogenesis protein CcmF